MKIKVHTSFIGSTGYNLHSRNFFTELSKLVKLKIRNFTVGDSWKGLTSDPHENEIYLSDYQKHLICEQTVYDDGIYSDVEIYDGTSDIQDYDIDLVLNESIHYYFYDFSKFKGKFKIAYNVWESTKQPQDFFNILLKYDQVWVPTNWQKNCLIEQGYPEDKIFIVPEGVDSSIFNSNKIDSYFDYDNNRFKFIVIGKWDNRKSTREIIETFLKTFKKEEPVDLLISVDNNISVDGMHTTEERLRKFNLIDSRIKIINFLDRDKYAHYIKSSNVFLSCSRGEGWNLPLIEAMSCGVPSIYSNWGAQLEFAQGKGHPVKILGEVDVVKKDSILRIHHKHSDIGKYCEPDFDDLSKVMRDVYVNYWEYKKKSLKDSIDIKNKFTWKNSALISKNLLDKLLIKKDVVFFTGGDKNYLSLVEKCVESLNKYSKIPVIVYGFNCNVNFNYPNMISRSISINREKKFNDRDTRAYYYKIDASLDCIKNDDSKIYIWLDGDCVVNYNIDSIKNYINEIQNYPLCMRYKHDNLIHFRNNQNKGHGDEVGEFFKLERNNNFTAATGLYMFDERSKWFFEEVLEHHEYFLKYIDVSSCIDDMAFSEERLFNALFWKYNFNKNLPITWISNAYYNYESGNIFDFKIENYIRNGFDVMFNYEGTDILSNNLYNQSKILFFHGQKDIQKIEQLNDNLEVDKLMIVAHPDDETIFGGGMLLKEYGWKVIVVTDGGGDNNNSDVRKKEFINVMNHLNVKDYELLGFRDDMNNVYYDENEVEDKLRSIIDSRNWKKIITHNSNGEYGHIIHKSVHKIVKKIVPDVLEFGISDNDLDDRIYNIKMFLLSLYESQNTNLPGFVQYLKNEKIYE